MSLAPLPYAYVDLDAVDANVRSLLATHDKPVRVATKSIRVPWLLRYLLKTHRLRGLMAYSVREAAFLVKEGFDDILVAYPTVQRADVDVVSPQMMLTVDSGEHVDALKGTRARVVVDVDVSWRLLGAHIGVRRSPLRAIDATLALIDRAEKAGLRVEGLLTYEAHIAGLGDASWPVRVMKKLAQGPLRDFRGQLAEKVKPRLFNGAGSGSLHIAGKEPWLTELTAGSGFLCSHLFDHLKLQPALFFATQVTRHPAPGIVTVHGGGYTASGSIGRDRLPIPYHPKGLSLLNMEGAGEVQTPLRTPVALPIGSEVIFRPAKTGELAEHFNEYLLLRGGKVIERTPTYRGCGQVFL